jgi:Arc/MetJ-type ribon-helix-helix transcriptional regulator
MSVSLSDETQKLIEERMKDGGFSTPDELVRVAIQTLNQVRGEDIEFLDAETQAAIARAEAQSERGEGIPAAEAFEQIRRRYSGQ